MPRENQSFSLEGGCVDALRENGWHRSALTNQAAHLSLTKCIWSMPREGAEQFMLSSIASSPR